MNTITFRPIGVIHSPYRTSSNTPIQGYMAPEAEAAVEIYSEFAAGLRDLEGFSHIHLLYHLHLSRPWQPLVKPFLDTELRGVFACRAPSRPNAIGLSVVKLLKREENILRIAGADMVDGTPLLDIKPYVPDFDIRSQARVGWYARAKKARETCQLGDERFVDKTKK